MDITTPRRRGDAVHRLHGAAEPVISYTASWQGYVVERSGYPTTLVLDAVVGLIGLALLPLMRPRKAEPAPAAVVPATV